MSAKLKQLLAENKFTSNAEKRRVQRALEELEKLNARTVKETDEQK